MSFVKLLGMKNNKDKNPENIHCFLKIFFSFYSHKKSPKINFDDLIHLREN